MNREEYVPLEEVDIKGPGLIYGEYKEAFIKKCDVGKDFMTVYNEEGLAIGHFEDLHEPTGPTGPIGEP